MLIHDGAQIERIHIHKLHKLRATLLTSTQGSGFERAVRFLPGKGGPEERSTVRAGG
jgi:hypothetical protein